MTGELIPVGENLIVRVWDLDAPGGGQARVADVWLEDPEAREHFYERRRIGGRLYGRVGSRRRRDNTDAERRRVETGEHALATQTLRQAGVKARRITDGRGWL